MRYSLLTYLILFYSCLLFSVSAFSADLNSYLAMKVLENPKQQDFEDVRHITHKGYNLELFSKFDMEGLVLSRHHYSEDKESDLVPVDLALGWLLMSNSMILDELSITQSKRYYYYAWKGQPPIPRKMIVEQSANMHFIPANDEVKAILKSVQKDDIVSLEGYLVDVSAEGDSEGWKSSRVRSDTGKGACELIYLENIEITRE